MKTTKGFSNLCKKHGKYVDFRKEVFTKIGVTEEEENDLTRASADKEFPLVVFKPKKILFFKDLYFCRNNAVARKVTSLLMQFPDIEFCEMKMRWVSIQYRQPNDGSSHVIPGQTTDGREHMRKR